MSKKFDRTKRLLGSEAMDKLKSARVAVFGIGGVGGHAADALVRSGIGAIDIIDSDEVAESNINRQLIATTKTVGRKKVEVMKEHLLEINPDVKVTNFDCFFLPETKNEFDFTQYDYVIDAVDTVTAKLALVESCKKAGVPIISSMGAGNKLDPAAFQVADISQTMVCPLAKVMRRELKKRNIKNVKVVYSKEEPAEAKIQEGFGENLVQQEKEEKAVGRRKSIPGSVAFVPSAAGLILAGEVIRDLTMGKQKG